MKVLFSNPPGWISQDTNGVWTSWVRAGSRWPFSSPVRSSPGRYVIGDYVVAPLFLMYAASHCRQVLPDVEVRFRDSIALRESASSWLQFVTKLGPDFVIIESATPSWEHDVHYIRRLERLVPAPRVIITGPIATAKGAEILAQHPNVVACIKGEPEKGIVRVLKGERGVIDHDLLETSEMNQAPPPWIDSLHARLYYDANPVPIWPQLQTWSSRGCPFRCVWCVWPATMTGNDPTGEGKRTARYYTEDYIAGWVGEAVERWGYQSVYDDSDTFNLGTKHTEAMCRAYKSVGVPWGAMCRADTIKAETWGLMYESGCRGVKIGVESGDQYVIDKIINKHLDLDVVRDTVRLLSKIGMRIHGTFSFGNPGETKEQMMRTKAFIAELYTLGMTSHQESGVAEIEGTPLATLTQLGYLNKYPGAKMDDKYHRESDGSRKMLQVIEDLRNG